MVRLTTSVLAVSLLAVPALAASSEQYERSVAESDLYGRDFLDVEDAIVAREQLEEFFGREFVNDIEERSPFGLGLLFKGLRAAVKVGEKAHKAHEHVEHFQGNDNDNNNHHHHRREFDEEEFDLRDFDEDLEAREPGRFGAVFRVAKGLARKHGHHAQSLGQFIPQNNDQNQNQNQRREFDEDLEAREPGRFGAVFRVAKGLARKHGHHAQSLGQFIPQNNDQSQNQNQRREFDEDLEAREPGRFGAVFRVAKGLARKHGHHAQSLGQFIPQNNDQNQNQNQRREFDEEFDVRDFDEDLEAREPGRFGAVFRVAKGLARKHGHHAQSLGQFIPQNNDQNQRREFDELEDLLEREFYDELD